MRIRAGGYNLPLCKEAMIISTPTSSLMAAIVLSWLSSSAGHIFKGCFRGFPSWGCKFYSSRIKGEKAHFAAWKKGSGEQQKWSKTAPPSVPPPEALYDTWGLQNPFWHFDLSQIGSSRIDAFSLLPTLQKHFVNNLFVFAWEFWIENGGDFWWLFSGLRCLGNKARKLLEKFGENSEQKFGRKFRTKIRKIRGTFVLPLLRPNTFISATDPPLFLNVDALSRYRKGSVLSQSSVACRPFWPKLTKPDLESTEKWTPCKVFGRVVLFQRGDNTILAEIITK